MLVGTRRWFALGVVVAAVGMRPAPARAVDPDSQLIGCDQADRQVTITASSHLDPSCTWTRGVEIVASDVVLDCQGAHIAAPDRRYGILVTAPADVALANIVVRNCHVEGFLNNVRITREGFRDLAEGAEYDHAFSNIVIEDSTLLNSRGTGVFVDGYVTDVTLRNLHIEGSGSAGIYLEAGSKDNVVENNEIVNNGYSENGPNGQFFEGTSIWFWGTGREGLAIDGSRNNRVVGNHFSGNSAGAVFLYKNCGEFVNQRPERWWHRRYGADGNLIEGNTIVGEDNGVWIGSRMGENTWPMDCSDPAYVSSGLTRVVLDYADDNVVRANVFENVTYGVRVEDDGAVVADNEFSGADAGQQAVIVGTRFRTPALGLPVEGATITGNRSAIAGNPNPYRWIHGHAGTTFAGNESFGRLVGLCEGVQPPTNLFIFTLAFEIADPENPPTGGPPVVPPPEPLPPCPLACAGPVGVVEPRIIIRGLGSPPGDDRLVFEGRMTLPQPFAPALDPIAVGVGMLINDSMGGAVLDLRVPGGAYDPATRVGWKFFPRCRTWRYLNRSPAPPAGITAVTIKDLSRRSPGEVRFSVRGRRGAYTVDATRLPLAGLLVLDPPTAETGQCGQATFPGPAPSCTSDTWAAVCR
jgi:parallel beta-helix repeat protein